MIPGKIYTPGFLFFISFQIPLLIPESSVTTLMHSHTIASTYICIQAIRNQWVVDRRSSLF